MKKAMLLTILVCMSAVGQNNAPSVSISLPEDYKNFIQGEIIEFSGSAFDLEDGKIPGSKLTWRSDVDGFLGNGESIKKRLSVDDHIVTLEALDSKGGKSVASLFISVKKKEVEKPQVKEPVTEPVAPPVESSLPAVKPEPSKAELEAAAEAILAGLNGVRFKGICTSFYRKNQSPEMGILPSEEEMRADIKFAKNLTGCLRGYGLNKVLEKFPEICEQEGIDCIPGVWLGKYPEENAKELAAIQRIVAKNFSSVKSIIVGNEVLLRRDMTTLELIKIIQTVKSQTTLPVTTAEDWETWKENPHLVKEVDYILAHVHPYWRGIEPENAALHVLKVWQHLTEIFPGKKVVIGETGWPSQGDANGKAVASPENQSRFLAQFLQLAEKYQIEYFYFDLFDESFKVNVEGPCGGHWGLFYEDGSLKPANRFIFPADAEVKISRPAKVVTITSASLPLNVYTEGGDEKNAFCPSGWMGDYNNIVLDPACTTNPHSGQTCTKIVYRQGSQGWGGIYWQYPIQNRGEYPGYSVKGAKAVTFWARGEKGGEKSIFKIGGINESQFKFRDSFGPLATGTLKLTQDWQKLEIDLSKADTSSLIGGFCWVTTSFSDSITIFLDDIVIN